jgi:hypothetical protein
MAADDDMAQFEDWDRLPMSSGDQYKLCYWWPKNLLGTPPIPTVLAHSQLIAPMTTDLINFTNNTKESSNSLAV